MNIYTAGNKKEINLPWQSISIPGPVGSQKREDYIINTNEGRMKYIYIWFELYLIFEIGNEITTHRAIRFAGLHAARIIISYTTRCVPLPFPPDIDLFQDFNIAAHTRCKLRPQMNQVSGPRTKPEIRWFLVVHLLQR